MSTNKKDDLKRFLNYVNHLSPWNLWTPSTWNKPVDDREINPSVIEAFNRLYKKLTR